MKDGYKITPLSLWGKKVDAYQDRMVKVRFALKERMTREEWAKAFPLEQKAATSNGQ